MMADVKSLVGGRTSANRDEYTESAINSVSHMRNICSPLKPLGLKLRDLCWLASASTMAATAPAPLLSFDEAVKATRDVWGEAAMAQPNGASYEFFTPLLAPPRYVNADFRYYPIVLSAPNSPVKARLISNGSGVNLRGGARSWNDPGTPFTFRVGPDELIFGTFRDRLSEPTLADGY